jgi:hypothetical protein
MLKVALMQKLFYFLPMTSIASPNMPFSKETDRSHKEGKQINSNMQQVI